MSGRVAVDVDKRGELPQDRVAIRDSPGFYRRGQWVVFPYRDRRGRQRWGKARTLTEARRAKAAVVTDVARGEHRPQTRVSFATYARSCMESYQGRTSKAIDPITRADYQARLEQDAIPFFGETPLGTIEPADIKAFCAHVAARKPACRSCRAKQPRRAACKACGGTGRRAGAVSANTVRLALAPVKVIFATAFEDGVIRVNPSAGVRVLTPRARVLDDEEDEGPVKAMTEAQLQRLFIAIAEKKRWIRWQLFFRVLLELGLRVGEAIELRWRDIDLGAGTVKVRRGFYRGRVGPPKTKFGRRTLRLTKPAAEALWALRKETKARDGDLVFTGLQGGRIDASNLMRDVLKPAARAAGVGGWIGFHTFRHTCATLLFTKAGWNAKQVQIWLGHHSPEFTLRLYVHLLPGDLPEPAELVGNSVVTALPAQARTPDELQAAETA